MYIPKIYRNESVDDTREFIRRNGFATLVSTVAGRPWATHIPLLLDRNDSGKDILHGHISKANPQWKNFSTDQEVLAIFLGPHAYISPSWYDHENVPTWNYLAVHVYGKISVIDGEKLLQSLSKLTDVYEHGKEHPVSVDRLSAKTLHDNLHGVVGFEIEISDIHSAKKLSQNRHDLDYANIIKELDKTGNAGDIAIAREMEKNRNL